MGANDRISDNLIRHALRLERLKESHLKSILSEIRVLELDLMRLIFDIDPAGTDLISAVFRRLNKLITQASTIISKRYKVIGTLHQADIIEFAKFESSRLIIEINKPFQVPIINVALTPEVSKQIATESLVGGAELKTWWERHDVALQNRFADQVRQGLDAKESTAKIISRIRGTKAGGFKDGIMSISRRSAEAMVRTSIQNASNEIRERLYESNGDVIKSIQQRSTLDGRTSDICMAYSGLQWTPDDRHKPIGHSLPYNNGPPRHPNCRSSIFPVTYSWEELSGRKIKTPSGGSVKGVDALYRSELKKQGLRPAAIRRSQARVQAALDGQVPDDLNYEQWLMTKPESFQRAQLGATRFDLWSEGRIGLRDLVNQRGRPVSVAQLENA